MALTGQRYIGTFQGHTIELVRNNWVKTLKLLIDGREVAGTTCHLPRRITLTGTLDHDGRRLEVVARSVPRYLLWATGTIEVDGEALPVTKTR
ncbi:MAG TPA: hypothetical protein VKD90_25690 [Gemmataceae bacterium]|nr:hypothetical protein [Gemmataceae bacterium]